MVLRTGADMDSADAGPRGITRRRTAAIAVLFAACSMTAFGLTTAVTVKNGVPQLLVNGSAVRPRIFWGHGFSSGGSAPMTADWQRYTFTFDASVDDDQCTLHLRFGEEPGTVSIDDVSITDDTVKRTIFLSDLNAGSDPFTERWSYWCKNLRSPGLSIAVGKDAGRDSPGLAVALKKDDGLSGLHLYSKTFPIMKGHRYTVSVWAKAAAPRSMKPEVRRMGGDYRFYAGLPGPFVNEMNYALAGGVNIVSFPVKLCWNEPGKEDYAAALTACEKVLSVNPKAYLLPRIGMNAPAWWRASHPGASMKYENGKENDQACVASEAYRTEAAAALSRVIRELEKRFGGNIIGYHPDGQNTGEWFYYDSWKQPLCGYDEATAAAWRAVSGAAVPTPEMRRASIGNIRHPKEQAEALAFEAFRQASMADMLRALARAIREAAPDKLSVFFYGYLFEFAGVPNGPANSGHYALRTLLSCPDIDMLCAPISYFHRGLGGATTVMTAAESVPLAGKMWLNEDDTRTHLTKETSFPGWKDGGTNLAETRNLLIRNVASEACRNIATWWMDLGGSGWFEDPALWADMKRLEVIDDHFKIDPTPYRPDVAVVIDEVSMRSIAANNAAASTTRPLAYTGRSNFNLMGAPYGQYLIDDVIAGKVKAKMYVFLNAIDLTHEQRSLLRKAVAGAASVWCWLPGYIDGDALSTAAVEELTGFSVSAYSAEMSGRVSATERALKHDIPSVFGPDSLIRPMLSPEPRDGDEVLAVFKDGKPAVIYRAGSGASVFSATTELPQELLRMIAKRAGVHLYTETDAVIAANGPYIVVHACSTGPVTVNARGTVYDAFTSDKLGGPSVTLEMKFGETRVLRVFRQ